MKIETVKGLPHMTFIDTGIKIYGHGKVYKGYMFYNDIDYEMFQGYFYKTRHYVMNSHNEIKKARKLERFSGMTMKSCDKPLSWNWEQWFDYHCGLITVNTIKNEITNTKMEVV